MLIPILKQCIRLYIASIAVGKLGYEKMAIDGRSYSLIGAGSLHRRLAI